MKTKKEYEEIAKKIAAVYAENAATYAEVDLIQQCAKEIMFISAPELKQQ